MPSSSRRSRPPFNRGQTRTSQRGALRSSGWRAAGADGLRHGPWRDNPECAAAARPISRRGHAAAWSRERVSPGRSRADRCPRAGRRRDRLRLLHPTRNRPRAARRAQYHRPARSNIRPDRRSARAGVQCHCNGHGKHMGRGRVGQRRRTSTRRARTAAQQRDPARARVWPNRRPKRFAETGDARRQDRVAHRRHGDASRRNGHGKGVVRTGHSQDELEKRADLRSPERCGVAVRAARKRAVRL